MDVIVQDLKVHGIIRVCSAVVFGKTIDMRKLGSAIVLCLIWALSVLAKPMDSRLHSVGMTLDNGVSLMIDERFELVCTAFRLAGAKEYVTGNCPSYMREVDEYFSPYKEHALVGYIQEIRESFNFAYSIPALASQMVEITKGHVRVSPDWDLTQVCAGEYESCWNEQIFREFVRLLDSFYRESKFHAFFVSHLPFYEKVVAACSETPSLVRPSWFQDFFGLDPVGVDLIVGLCIGPSNYSLHAARLRKNWDSRLPIAIGTTEDASAIPSFCFDCLPVIVHEIGHYYSNPLVDHYYEAMKESMDFVYGKIRDQMARIGYGNAQDVTGEWINELFVNCYLKQNPTVIGGAYNVSENVEKGYLWMERAVHFMDHFFSDRDTYPSVREFMPHLVSFVNSLPGCWPDIEREFENRNPYVMEVYPAGVITSRTQEIRITFSMPMKTGIQGLSPLPGYESLPLNYTDVRWEGDRTFVLDLRGHDITPGIKYGVRLPSDFFLNTGCYRMKEDFDLILETVE